MNKQAALQTLDTIAQAIAWIEFKDQPLKHYMEAHEYADVRQAIDALENCRQAYDVLAGDEDALRKLLNVIEREKRENNVRMLIADIDAGI